MSQANLIDICAVNSMTYEVFIVKFGNVIEHCPLCAAAVWAKRPYHDIHDLHVNFSRFIDELPSIGKEGILRCHPDLAGQLAKAGSLTTESAYEQNAAGLNDITEEELRFLDEKNKKYREKFGFPFVICARENKKATILQGIESRLENTKDAELIIGTEEVKKICYLRLCNIIDVSTEAKL